MTASSSGGTASACLRSLTEAGRHSLTSQIVGIQLINCTEQVPHLESDSCSASQEISPFVWNPNVQFCCHRVHSLFMSCEPDESSPHSSTLFPCIHLFVILTSAPRTSVWSLPPSFPNRYVVCICHLFRACNTPHSSSLISPILCQYCLMTSTNDYVFLWNHSVVYCLIIGNKL